MNYYNQIKEELINNEIYKKVKDYSKNKNDLTTYYNVGKLLVEAQGGEKRSEYGNKLIKEYSLKLTNELGRGYKWRNLYNMRLYYIFVSQNEILQSLIAKSHITWTHLTILLIFNDINKIYYYIKLINDQKLSVRELKNKIKNNEYERLSKEIKNKLIANKETKVTDFIKNPILIKNSYNFTKITEKILKQLILEDLDNFLTELGEGFTYIKKEYKIKIRDRYNYIDLLLFNIKYNCYVVVELKITELKKEHIGQIQTYMNYIDRHIKTINQNKTIGIIICKKEDRYVMEYCSDNRIYNAMYNLV